MNQKILQEILDELKEMKQAQNQMQQSLNRMQEEQHSMLEVQKTMQSDLQATKERIPSIESKQSSILEHSQIAAKLDNMATKDDLAYFDKKISEHEREIFKLKNA